MVLFKGRHAYASSFLLDTGALIQVYNERQPSSSKHRECSEYQTSIPKLLCM